MNVLHVSALHHFRILSTFWRPDHLHSHFLYLSVYRLTSSSLFYVMILCLTHIYVRLRKCLHTSNSPGVSTVVTELYKLGRYPFIYQNLARNPTSHSQSVTTKIFYLLHTPAMFRLAFPVIFFFACALAVELPKNFKKCYRDDPNLDACLQKAVQAAIKDMVTGTKELKIAPIDPLRIKKLDISQGSGPVTVELNFTDVDIHGMSSVLVDSVSAKLDGDEKTLTLNLVASKPLIMLGQYTVDGKVLVLPIQGSGNATLDLLSVTATIKLIGSVVQRQGVDYLIFKKVDFVLNPQSMKLNFSNLFNGNKELGDNMNKFLNENWSQVYDELRHSFQNAFALTIADLTHRFFAQVPYDSLIPPSS